MPDAAGSTNAEKSDSLVRLLMMLMLGGAVAFPYVGTQRAPSASGGTAASAVAGALASGTIKSAGEVGTDALTLLAEFAGIDSPDAEIFKEAEKDALGAFAQPGWPIASAGEVRAALTELRALNLQVEPADPLADLARRIATRRPPGFSTGIPGASRPDVPNIHALLRKDRETARADGVRAALKQIQVEFVVATVPDAIDSNAHWLFDPMVAAISNAAATSGYVLDRFYIPDWDPIRDAGADRASTPRTLHERWPGVVLFRDKEFGSATGHRRLLVVSLVAETPTSGIHQAAFKNAVRVIDRWTFGECRTVRVLGPSFSGSMPSLSLAIGSFKDTCLKFRVVSGGATGPANPRSIQPLAGGPETKFRATVLPDDFVTRKTIEFLLSTDTSIRSGDRVALLVEGDTTYGLALGAPPSPITAPTPDQPTRPCAERPTVRDQAECIIRRARRLPFPLHISRLRSAADAPTRPSSGPSAGPHFLALPLDEPGTATDQIPSLSPKSTSSSVELVLANILDTIDREHITTVGLLATDTRDKLFLAEQIARRDATVRLFTLESDLFYLHPDYSAYTLGMIVASTYPLFLENQRWVNRLGRLTPEIQFPTTNTQGIYNALVALLNYNEDGSAAASVAPPALLDYATPGVKDQRPALWISAVGRDALWPLAFYDAGEDAGAVSYVQPILPPASLPAEVSAHASPSADFLFLGLLAVVALHTGIYTYARSQSEPQWRGKIQRGGGLASLLGKYADIPRSHRAKPYLLIMFAALLAGFGYATGVFALFFWNLRSPAEEGWKTVAVSATAVGSFGTLLWLIGCTCELTWSCWRGALARAKAGRGQGRWDATHVHHLLIAVALALAVAAGGLGVTYFVQAIASPPTRVYYFERVTHLENGVSPALPLTFILATIYLWGFANVKRLTAASGQRLEDGFMNLKPFSPEELRQGASELKKFVDGAVQTMPWHYCAIIVLVLGVFGYMARVHPLATPESMSFTWAFRTAWLLVQLFILLAFAHAVHSWQMLRRSLKPFASTPMIAAFDRLPPAMYSDRLSPRQPTQADLRHAVRVGEQLRLAMLEIERARLDEPWRTSRAPYAEFDLTKEQFNDLADAIRPKADETQTSRWWPDTIEWKWLSNASTRLAPVVKASWGMRRENALATVNVDVDVHEIKGDVQRWFLRAEEFLAMQILFIVREMLARLVDICFVVIVSVLLMVGAQHSFPFQPRQELLGTAWIYVLSGVSLVFWIFVQMERDAVLSAFASTEAGKIRWDSTLWSKVLLYGVIPIATIFAAQFPQIGSSILGWIAPVQGALR